jgi:chemotaxis protein histidine kinase CheA
MLNDFASMSQEEMMECAALLEDPLMKLEEENKAREAAEREAAAKARAEAEKRAAIEEEARRKREAEAAALAKQKAVERERQAGMVKGLQQELATCNTQYESAVVAAESLSQCQTDLHKYQVSSVPVDPRIKPLFGNRNLEVVVLPVIAVFAILFWMLGCCMGTSRVTPLVNPSVGNAGVVISEVSIRPGCEICVITNKTFNDVVSHPINTIIHENANISNFLLLTPAGYDWLQFACC